MSLDKRISHLLDPNQFVDRCVHCGAMLPMDVKFQKLHMKVVHGLIV